MQTSMTKQGADAGAAGVIQLIRGLSDATPEAALADAAGWVESLMQNQDLAEPERLELLFIVDEALQAHARAYVDHYLAALRQGSAERRSVWAMVRGHWSSLLDAYADSLNLLADDRFAELAQQRLAELAVRAIRVGAQRAKWDAFEHGPADHSVWLSLNQAYRQAVRCGVSHQSVRLRSDRATESSVEREYMRAVALHSVGMDQLDAERLELASRIIHYALPYLELSSMPSQASLYWVDAQYALPPARLVKTPANAILPRFFSGMVAVPSLEELLDMVIAGDMPAVLKPGHDCAPGLVSSVLAHIIKGWSMQPPVRRHRRYPMPGEVLVVEGLERFAACLAGEMPDYLPPAWTVRDASLQGVGLAAPGEQAQQLNVGTLVGLHSTDGDRWRVGAVRRIWRSSEHEGQVGVEMLGGTPVVASADDGSTEARVLLLEPLQRGQPVRIAVPLPGLRANVPLYLKASGKTVKLTPLTTLEYGADFEIRAYLYAG